MQLEDYFDFQSPDDIRIRGHRIGIESILYEYVYRSLTPEEIAKQFETLTLDQVYATILFYLRNPEQSRRYLADWLEFGRNARDQQKREAPEFVEKMRRLRYLPIG
jgi:uncharacterized protein (DUF433 family)